MASAGQFQECFSMRKVGTTDFCAHDRRKSRKGFQSKGVDFVCLPSVVVPIFNVNVPVREVKSNRGAIPVDRSPLVACQYRNNAPLSSYGIIPLIEFKSELKYVKACKGEKWTFWTMNLRTGKIRVKRFKCKSWRHEGECARARNAYDFVRIREAIKGLGEGWVYMVLTFNQNDSVLNTYKKVYECWDRFRKRLCRKYGKIKYIVTVERHKSGYPHLNVLIFNRELFGELSGEGWRIWRSESGWGGRNVVECGFGFRLWAETVRSEDAIAGYFVKLCSEAAKLDQLPVNAPKHFRRIRASQGLLPKRIKCEDITGGVIKVEFERVKVIGDRIVVVYKSLIKILNSILNDRIKVVRKGVRKFLISILNRRIRVKGVNEVKGDRVVFVMRK
jgi:hypothetical protein